MLNLLARPFAYLTISHPRKLPLWINWRLPMLISAMCVAITWFALPLTVDFWGEQGIASKTLGFVQSLPGFYIAALAAIATFGSEDMQKPMPGTAPTMTLPHNGGEIKNAKLTRRLFLSSMFAYLTALSFLLTIGTIILLAIAKSAAPLLDPDVRSVMKSIAAFVYLVFVTQLLTVTFWGLYYLGERLHLADT
jgi:hypothetical protein